MKIITTSTLSNKQKQAVFNIWNTEYPIRLLIPEIEKFEDFINSLNDQKYYLLVNETDEIIGWATTFYIEAVRCFFIMLSGKFHGKGYGTVLLNELKMDGSQLFGWAIDHNNDVKANGELYPSPITFYLKNGFTVNSGLRLENEKISAVNILWETSKS